LRGVKPIIGLLVAAALACWGYCKFFPSDEAVIHELLVEAAEAASIGPEDSAVAKFASVKRLINMCTEDIRLKVEAPGARVLSVQGRERLGEALAGVRATVQSLDIDLLDVGVEVEEDRTGATAQFIARVNRSGGQEEIIQEFRVVLKRVDGDWKFAQVEPLASLSM